MSSTKIMKIADRIVKEDKESFDSLIEFEKTKKIRSKIRLNFTINKSIALRFKRFCKEKGYNMSAKMEQAMEKLIKDKWFYFSCFFIISINSFPEIFPLYLFIRIPIIALTLKLFFIKFLTSFSIILLSILLYL